MDRKNSSNKIIYFLLDPLENLHGPVRPPFLIAKELKQKFQIVFISPIVKNELAELLKSSGFEVLTLNRRFYFSGSMLTMEAWLGKSEFNSKNHNGLVFNFSQCFSADAYLYYGQGPITMALDDLQSEMKQTHKLAYRLTRKLLVRRDKAFNFMLRKRSQLFIANSRFCASQYENWGIAVDEVIYPPLDCNQFQPSTSNPSGGYMLTYIGKETKYSILKTIANNGIKIKAFGSKAPYIPRKMFETPNIEFLGSVSDEELVNLYSNALCTLFTFTREEFGYVPVESMACGTPVLTFNKQGPQESLINDQTGWLVESDEEMANMATRIWKDGYPQSIRIDCRRRSIEFDAKKLSKKWLELIQQSPNKT